MSKNLNDLLKKRNELADVKTRIFNQEKKLRELKRKENFSSKNLKDDTIMYGIFTIVTTPVVSLMFGMVREIFNHDKMVEKAQEVTNQYAIDIFQNHGISFIPDQNSIRQQILDYSTTLTNPIDIIYWQDMASSISAEFSSIAYEYGMFNPGVLIGTAVVFTAFSYALLGGFTLRKHILNKKKFNGQLFKIEEKIYNLKKEKSALELDIERLENNKTS